MYDVLIIGAGPAGSSAAGTLSAAGLRSVLLEKGGPNRDKPCAGGVSIETFSLLPKKAETVIEGWVEHVVFSLRGERRREAALPPETMAMVQRSRFDPLLAQESGAEIRTGSRVTQIRNIENGVEAVTSEGTVFKGRYGIIASGSISPFDSFFGGSRNQHRRGVALVAEPKLEPEELLNHAGTAVFEFGRIHGGYIWSFPKSDHLSVGAGLFGTRGEEKIVAAQRALGQMRVAPAQALRFRGHPILLPSRKAALRRGRFLRTGEAAGLVDPLIGEGIRHAVRSGRMAAEAVLSQDLRQYELRCRREILGDLLTAVPLARLFYGFPSLAFRLGIENPYLFREFIDIFNGKSGYRRLAARFPWYIIRELLRRSEHS